MRRADKQPLSSSGELSSDSGQLEGDADVSRRRAIARKTDAKRIGILRELQLSVVAQHRGAGDLRRMLRAGGSQRSNCGFSLRPALNKGIKSIALGGKANVAGREIRL